MATMNVSLPDPMKNWVEKQAQSGQYSNVSDYVRDLIRHDQERAEKVERMQVFVTEALESGPGQHSMEELRERAARQCSGS